MKEKQRICVDSPGSCFLCSFAERTVAAKPSKMSIFILWQRNKKLILLRKNIQLCKLDKSAIRTEQERKGAVHTHPQPRHGTKRLFFYQKREDLNEEKILTFVYEFFLSLLMVMLKQKKKKLVVIFYLSISAVPLQVKTIVFVTPFIFASLISMAVSKNLSSVLDLWFSNFLVQFVGLVIFLCIYIYIWYTLQSVKNEIQSSKWKARPCLQFLAVWSRVR